MQMKQPVTAVTAISADSGVVSDHSSVASTASQSELSTAARDGSVTWSLSSLQHTRTVFV